MQHRRNTAPERTRDPKRSPRAKQATLTRRAQRAAKYSTPRGR